jgi:hypothetical protein
MTKKKTSLKSDSGALSKKTASKSGRAPGADLCAIKGVGAKRAEKLFNAAFDSPEKIASSTPEAISQVIDVSPKIARDIIDKASDLLAAAPEAISTPADTPPKKDSPEIQKPKPDKPAKAVTPAPADEPKTAPDKPGTDKPEPDKRPPDKTGHDKAGHDEAGHIEQPESFTETSETAMLLNITIAVLAVVIMLLLLQN